MLAQVDDGVGSPDVAKPAIEGVVVVRRRQVGLMIDGVGVHAVAARRLQRHEDVAEIKPGQGDVTIVDVGRARRSTPLADHLRPAATPAGLRTRPHSPRQRLGPRRWRAARRSATFHRSEHRSMRFAINSSPSAGQIVDVVAGSPHGLEDSQQRRGGVEADGVADLRRLAGGVGEDERDALLRVRLPSQVREAGPGRRPWRHGRRPGRSGSPRFARRGADDPSTVPSGSLKEIGTVMMRPSNSGRATFMAVSSGFRPRAPASHCHRVVPAAIAWRTGMSRSVRAPADRLPGVNPSGPTSLIANDIVEIKTSIRGPSGPMKKSKAAGHAVARPPVIARVCLSDSVKTGSATAPRASIARTRVSTKSRLPLSQWAR